MARVWTRPTLLLLEVCWRWLAVVPLLSLAFFAGARALRGVTLDTRAFEAITVFQPTAAATLVEQQLRMVLPPLWPTLRWWLPLALFVWTGASAVGRIVIWRRLDGTLQPRYAVVALLGLLRTSALWGMYGLWTLGLLYAARVTVTGRAAAGLEPSLVLLMALAVTLTLALFLVWSLLSSVLDSAPLFSMSAWPGRTALARETGLGASLRSAWHARALRSKLIETNLVMGIVRVALLVLALVFSATPLPFASEESTGFLLAWWSFVALLYLVFSDLFQVIRRAAYLRFFEVLVTPRA